MKHRILIVEDNLTFAISLEGKLYEWGHEILGIVDNGNDAIKKIQDEKPDIVLMDINIKGDFNGVEVAHAIKDMDTFVIFITGEKSEDVFNEAMKAKGVSYLVKPFDMLSLRGAIEFAMAKYTHSEISSPTIEPENVTETPVSDAKKLYFRKGKELIKVDLLDLNWMESDRNYCDLYTKDKRFTLRLPLRRLEEVLPKDKFMKVHKRFLVRLNAIDKVVLSEAKIYIGENSISIGRKFRADFLDRIDQLK